MKSIIISLSLILLVYSQMAYSIRIPKPPKIPKIPNPSNRLTNKNNNKEKQTFYIYEVEIVLAKGSRTKGSIRLKQNHLSVVTRKGDFSYSKKVAYKDISKIEIISWQETKLQGKDKKSTAYLFYPVEYRISTLKGKTYTYKGRLRQFEKFKLTNLLGKALIHGIFYDYWVTKGEKGKWQNSKSTKYSYNRKVPHPLALRKIIMIHKKEIKTHKKEVKKG
ncbi:MAG TPA: hypothetical protein ENI73_03995 [Spirochaetes bacterium]|nr:hypothetical protein [Spirochaetota bacterium]